MDRIQRTGLISLFLLLTVGAAGLLMKGVGSPPDLPPSEVFLRPGDLPAVNLVPPERRLLTIDPARFGAPPVPHPAGGKPRPRAGTARVLDLGPTPVGDPIPFRIIRVRENETLGEIAAREMGSSEAWQVLANANGIQDPRKLKLGQELRIPLQRTAKATGNAGAGAAREASATTALAPADADGWRTHLVLEDEVLGTISQRYYGTSREWERILRANGLDDPTDLRVGSSLRIPPLP